MALAVAAVLAAAGAGPGPAALAQTAPQAELVRIPFPQDDGSLTPYTFELGYSLMTLIYDTLLWRDADGVPQPWLARSVTPNGDGRQLTVRLVEGATWHDGRPVTAEDVAFTFRYVAGRPHPRFTAELRDVERLDVFDPTTLVISLRRPSPGFSDQPLADLPILPAHIWSGLAPDKAAPEGPAIGSGPYRMAEYRPGQGWRFEANASYFRGRPAAAVLEVSVNRDATSTLEDFRQRRTDMVAVNLPRSAQAEVTGPGIRLARGPSYLGTILLFNTRQAPFDRLEARQAVARLVRPERLAQVVGGAAAANRGYLHPASAWAPDDLLLPAASDAPAGSPGTLAGGPVRVLAPDNDPVKIEAGRQVVQVMKGAGLDAELVQLGREELVGAVGEDGSAPTFQAAIWSSPALASYDPVVLGRLFGSDPRDAATNLSGYRSAAFDAAAERIASTPDRAARRAAVDEALRTLATDVPVVPLFFTEGAFAFRPSIYDGWVFTKGTGILDKRSFV
ncbi:MAG: ABC transporter substrate-binding protein, partial [Acidimicrobiales bacterium]